MGEGPVMVRVRHRRARYYAAIATAVVIGTGAAVGHHGHRRERGAEHRGLGARPGDEPGQQLVLRAQDRTPIKHVVVLFDENESFDHYFGTYPYAANTDGSTFHAKPGTPKVNGLYTSITSKGPAGPLLTSNPNAFNPQRLSHSEALTCDQNHGYTPEQEAFNGGKMDQFVQYTESALDLRRGHGRVLPAGPGHGLLRRQHGHRAVELRAELRDERQQLRHQLRAVHARRAERDLGQRRRRLRRQPDHRQAGRGDAGTVSALNSKGLGTIYGDLDPAYDDCSDNSHASTDTNPVGVMTGQNIGDLLNAKNVSWGWFQGGFAPTSTNSAGLPVCGAEHENIGGNEVADYSPHHNPFEYYASTANPKHLPPSSEAAIGHTDQANHEYDLSDFYETLKDGNMPSVSYLKAAEYQDAHPGYSDPLDEQNFLVNTINQIEESKYWSSTAIVITYDDSDGWYDHQASKIVNGSNTSADDRDVLLGGHDAGQLPQPLRLRPAAAAGGHLALHQGRTTSATT